MESPALSQSGSSWSLYLFSSLLFVSKRFPHSLCFSATIPVRTKVNQDTFSEDSQSLSRYSNPGSAVYRATFCAALREADRVKSANQVLCFGGAATSSAKLHSQLQMCQFMMTRLANLHARINGFAYRSNKSHNIRDKTNCGRNCCNESQNI